MVPCDAPAIPKAPNNTSVILCEVSTLPPTTAASSFGFNIDSSGIIIFIWSKHPEFRGIVLLINNLKTYKTAAFVTAMGALRLFCV